MLGVSYAERQLLVLYAECYYAECLYADCRGAITSSLNMVCATEKASQFKMPLTLIYNQKHLI
jgi:hypothetical protein